MELNKLYVTICLLKDISGVPGIGKTLCVKEVANDIEEDEKLKGN